MSGRLTIMLCALTLAVTGMFAEQGRDGDHNRVRATLTGPAISGETPGGSAVSQSHEGENMFRVEVNDVNLPDGTVLSVVLVHEGNRMRAGELKLMSGSGELDLRSRDGDRVPQAQPGDTVMVDQNRMTVLAGVFF